MTETTTPPGGRIVTEQRGHLLLIGIDRPAKRNGFTPDMQRQLANSEDAAEGVRSFVERRAARFSGR